MSLSRFAVRNYRCFRDRQELEVSPVTIVLGKNNSGKSALVRAPLVFATGFGVGTSAPLDLEQLDVDPVDAFAELIFAHNVHGRIGVELEVGGDLSFTLTATVQHLDETRDAFISDWSVDLPDTRVCLQWVPETSPISASREYQISVDGHLIKREQVTFQGLVPARAYVPELRQLTECPPSLGTIRYLSPYRQRIRRQHRLPLGPPSAVGAQGQGVSAVLADDKVRGDGDVIASVNMYLKQIVPDWELAEVPAGPLWATVLVRQIGDQEIRVSLADAGAGLSQVLPILVQCALDDRAGSRRDAPLQIVEEPEMHLHPAAHAELADLYLRTARSTGTRFVVETHSETLLLRLRRRIAEDAYPPEMVRVYVVDQTDGVSSVRPVEIDQLGNLSNEWPEGYFSTDYLDVRALAAAQLRRSGDAA